MDILPNTYINFHTHKPTNDLNVFEIMSVHFDDNFQLKKEYFTLGKHPWWTKNKLTLNEKQEFLQLAKSEYCLGIGEIGLDKLKGETIAVQLQVFKELLQVASQVKKPVIIHCVKAFDKLIQVKKEFPNIKNWCVHGFSRHSQLANQLIKNGFYLSVVATENITSKYVELIKNIPLDRLFLETDDTDLDIKDIYLQVANIRNISVEELQIQMIANLSEFLDTDFTDCHG